MSEANFIAVVAADAHLDHSTMFTRSRPEIRGDSYYGLQQAIDLTIELEIPRLVCPGDTVEGLPADTPTSDTLLFLRKQLERLDSSPAFEGLWFINGQHDHYPNYMQAVYDRANYVDGQVVDIGGVNAGFMSYRRTPQLPDAVAGMQRPMDVFFCHQEWHHVIAMAGGPKRDSVPELDSPRLIIAGDLHERRKVVVEREGKHNVTVVSPGASHARKSNEPFKHSLVLLREDLTFKRVPLKSRIRLDFLLEDQDGFELLYDTLPAAIEKAHEDAIAMKMPPELHTPYLFISDGSEIAAVEKRLKEVIKDNVHLFYSTSLKSLSKLNRGKLTSRFDAKFDVPLVEIATRAAGKNVHVADLLSECLSDPTQSPKAGLLRWRDSYLSQETPADVVKMGESG